MLLVACDNASDQDSFRDAVMAEGRAAVQEAMEATGSPSVSIAFVEGKEILWAEAFGQADRDTKRHATPDTLYGACSISKMVATVSVMMLVDQGLLSLDEPLTTYIPSFSMPLDDRYRDITVRMLINHSSGLPAFDPGAVTNEPYPEYASDMLEGYKSLRLMYDPGSISSYNNDGFTMVQNLVQAVSGKTYQDFVREKIFTPLEMTHSHYLDVPLAKDAYAKAYNGETFRDIVSFNVYASGGLFTTPSDLSRLAMMLLNGGVYGNARLLSEASVSAMAENQKARTFNPVPYDENTFGLGWDSVIQPGVGALGFTGWQKTGDLSGVYGTDLLVLPGEKLAVVVFGASGLDSSIFSSKNAVQIATRVMLRALIARGKITGMPEALSATTLPTQEMTQEMRDYAGYYASSNAVYRLTFADDGSLSLDKYDNDWTNIYSEFKLRNDGWFSPDSNPFKGLRLLTDSGRQYMAIRGKGSADYYTYTMALGQRLESKTAISESWAERVNETWLPVNLDLTLQFPQKTENPSFKIRTINGLVGYLLGNKIAMEMNPASDNRLNGMFLMVPDNLRSMEDLSIETVGGKELLRAGSYLYRAKSTVPELPVGASTLSLGKEGYGEWLHTTSAGTLSISGSTSWFAYDADVNEIASSLDSDNLTLSGTGDKYLILNGEKESTIVLNFATQ